MSDRIKKFKKIDAHSHIGNFEGWPDVRITAKQLIAQMDEYNIEKTVLSTFPIEDSIIAVDSYPDRFIGAAWINPYEGKNALDVIKNCVNSHGFKAIKLHPLFQAYRANDDCVFPFAELAEELDIPLMIHSGHPPFSLPWSIAQLAELYPKVKMVMIHMGHGHGVYIQAALDMAKKFPNLYLETSGMPMHNKIKEAYETIGSDRIMFGIDAPFHHPSVEIQRSLICGLNDKQLEDLFYNNVKKLLKL
ncbi:amidohydrolase family protein [Anaerovorax odorimutans]|uniref:amidohydrolase family protein n=1 Tax=Anaerovorax odorimutans TaxID=109327 RepID=UPI00041A1944|nr:amidohydrolase family protein [Anaerovorax odorimutans]